MPTATDTPVETMRIPNVPIARVGTWSASTGKVNVTAADLESMASAHADGLVDHAPIKIGHVDKRFANRDGDPAYGWLANVKTGDGSKERPNADTLYADVEDVPKGLARIIPKAFRRRSIEMAHNVTTAGGKSYRRVLVGLALLGTTPPAVKGLADIVDLYSGGDVPWTAELITSWALGEDSDTTFIPQTPADPPQGDPDTTDSGTDPGGPMSSTAAAALGLADDASDADVVAAIEALKSGGAPAGAPPAAAGEPPAAPAAAGAPADPPADPPAAPAQLSADQLPPGTILITQAQWDASQATITKMAADRDQEVKDQAEQRRKQIIAQGVADGKITTDNLTYWTTALSDNEDNAVSLLGHVGSLVPTSQVGDPLAVDALSAPDTLTALASAAAADLGLNRKEF